MYKIIVLCKASFLTGMGHVVRQIHLGRVLRNRGMDIEFFVTDHQPSIELLRRENFSAKIVTKVEDLPGELNATYDLALLDIQDTKKDFIGAIRERARKIMSFEDLGDGRNHVDLLVDCNLEPEQARHLKPPVKALFGLPYSVLAEEFGSYHQQKKIFSESLEALLVTMGGTDPNNLTMQLARCFLQSRKKTAITFVAGPGFKETPALIQLASSVDSFKVLSQPGNMAELLYHHQAVCCSGGVTLHEALAIGTPAFVISQVMAQQEKTRPLEKRGTAIDLGLAKDFDSDKISIVWKLTKAQLESMSAKAKELVDGQGIVRVADEVIALLSN
jgi:UDP-2,4-diacetamido-2,4,6-trideoxy-beta-L-altropyranose hydrolase